MHSELFMCSTALSFLICVNFQNWLQFQEQYYLNKTRKENFLFCKFGRSDTLVHSGLP